MALSTTMGPSEAGWLARHARSAALAGLSAADRVARELGLADRLPDADGLIAAAKQRTGLGADLAPIREPLSVLLEACATEAELSLVGRMTVQWDAMRLLRNRLRLAAVEADNPAIGEEPIERPIFITGLPRSGTTFLHKLLTLDPANQAPRIWQTLDPYPRSQPRTVRTADRQLATFAWLAPGFRSLHPVDATSPQECSEITAHVFASLRFDTTYRVPGYRRWLDANGHLEAYRFHKQFLQHLQHRDGRRRWVLKCPDHVFALDAIQRVYPDALIVFVHRDPLKVLASVMTLTEVLRSPFTRQIDRAGIGREEALRWHDGAERMVKAARSRAVGPSILNLRHTDLVRDPLAAVRRLYAHFGLELSADTVGRIRRATAAEPNGGYGANRHKFATYGLDPDAELERFEGYMACFGIEREPTHGGLRPRADPQPIFRPALS